MDGISYGRKRHPRKRLHDVDYFVSVAITNTHYNPPPPTSNSHLLPLMRRPSMTCSTYLGIASVVHPTAEQFFNTKLRLDYPSCPSLALPHNAPSAPSPPPLSPERPSPPKGPFPPPSRSGWSSPKPGTTLQTAGLHSGPRTPSSRTRS